MGTCTQNIITLPHMSIGKLQQNRYYKADYSIAMASLFKASP